VAKRAVRLEQRPITTCYRSSGLPGPPTS
jgi:hypothetical protein